MSDDILLFVPDWPNLIGACVVAEGLIHLRARAGLRAVLIAAVALVAALSLLSYATVPDYSKGVTPPLNLAIGHFLLALAPVAVVVGALAAISRLKPVQTHVVVLATAIAAVSFLPIWGLVLSCYVAHDCL